MNSRFLPLRAGVAPLDSHFSGLAVSSPEIHALVTRSVAALQVPEDARLPRTAFGACEGAAGEVGVLNGPE